MKLEKIDLNLSYRGAPNRLIQIEIHKFLNYRYKYRINNEKLNSFENIKQKYIKIILLLKYILQKNRGFSYAKRAKKNNFFIMIKMSVKIDELDLDLEISSGEFK